MAQMPAGDATYEVTCPHCKRAFEAEPLAGDAPRNAGFKCPHCRLFVAWDRLADEQPPRAD